MLNFNMTRVARPTPRFSFDHYNPDQLVHNATAASMRGNKDRAHELSCAAVRSRAEWVLVAGKWHKRKDIMRCA